MLATRSMTRKITDLWVNLDPDLLLLIMMRLGLFDFISFRGVCKSWRSLAFTFWNKFMLSKQPMYLSISDRINKKECYIEDYTSGKLKTMIPHSSGRMCVGLTCGYLIFFGSVTRDFWLVNPFTRKELHFPGYPYAESTNPEDTRGVLVFSPSMSGWVLVILTRLSTGLAFSLAGKQAKWIHVSCNSPIRDLHFFKGKIYTLHVGSLLCELRLNPVPTFFLLKMKNFPFLRRRWQEFVSSGEKLFVMDDSGDQDAIEVNLDEMEWMNSERAIGEYDVFVSDLKCNAAIKPDTWAHPWTQYESLNYAHGVYQSKKKGSRFLTDMWYFPHDLLINNNADMDNGTLLNILEEKDEKNGNHMSCKVKIC